MDNKLTGGLVAMATFIAAIGAGAVTYDGTAYFCESRDLICIGERLSSTGKTCYYLVNGTEKGARCTEGWVPYTTGTVEATESVDIFGNNCLHTCEFQDTLKTHDQCYCDNGQWAYAGELI